MIPWEGNCFFIQNLELNNEGYDSEEGLPVFADEEVVEDPIEYSKESPIKNTVEGPLPAL
jgi:hypothetical protein